MQNNHQLEMSHDQISELIEGQKRLQKSNEQLSTYIIQLKTLISGNELDKDDKGMVGELRDTAERLIVLEQRVEKSESDKKSEKKQNRNYLVGFAAATTIFWAILQFVINYFSNHQH